MSQLRPGRPEAAAAIWAPVGTTVAGNLNSKASKARNRGIVRGVVGLVIGGVIYALWSQVVGSVGLALAAATLVLAVASPLDAYAKVETAVAALAKAVAAAVTWLAMGLIYFLVFTPFGKLTRHGPGDPLRRSADRSVESYWTPRDQVHRAYDRQF